MLKPLNEIAAELSEILSEVREYEASCTSDPAHHSCLPLFKVEYDICEDIEDLTNYSKTISVALVPYEDKTHAH